MLAWLAPLDGVMNIWVRTIGADDDRAVTDDTDRGVQGFFWAPDGRRILFLRDAAGDENWRINDVHLESGAQRDLTPFDDVQARIEHVDKKFPTTILVGLNRDDPQLHDVYRLDLESGELTKIVENPGFAGFVTDEQQQVRGAAAPQPDGGIAILVRDDTDSDWRPVVEVGQTDSLTTAPVAFSADGRRLLIISSEDANAARLAWLDLSTGARTVVAEDPQYDVGGVRVHPDTIEVEFVTFVKDRVEHVVLDPAVAPDVEGITALDDGDWALQGADHADRTWLVSFTLDDGPVRYWSWDRDAREGTFLFEHRPALSQYVLAKVEPFAFAARDGLEVHGYLTFPPGMPRHDLPTVLVVHGGPWARDTWGFAPEAQWLANRGYLVIQVNYRGSTGFGKAFLNAGDKAWGAAMHDDLLDGLAWAVEQGHVDPARVAIYGGSYGGYAALVGATFTPDVFACAIDVVGPSNLKTLIESIPPYWAPLVAQFHTRVGNPETEEAFLWERSPLSKVDQIRIPMLIAQGANDPRVKQAESEQIVAAMVANGIPHEYLLFEDEGHGFVKPENRLRFYAAAERFLAEHLGGRAE
ncbi:MAG: S9 family peptidase [Acidimicrobiia bacterium]|nr:S9 family peptidase [Acidimicrobiia bacterium]